jgi:hypothetical protein
MSSRRAVVYDGHHVFVSQGVTKGRLQIRETYRLRFFERGPLGKGAGIEVGLDTIDNVVKELQAAAEAIRATRATRRSANRPTRKRPAYNSVLPQLKKPV